MTANCGTMFELRGATKRFGDITAVHPMDLEIEEGKTTVFIGPSGCGKSTTLRMLIGLLQPDDGEVRFDGEPLAEERMLEMRRRMGYVIQGGGLFPHLTADENIRMMPQHLGWDEARIDQKIAEFIEITHFPKEGLDRYPIELSGGQQQRVSLMRALMLDPEVVLMDEPLGALDPLIRADLQEELKSVFNRLGKTVVIVTHDMDEAAFFGHQIVLMRDGRVVQAGSLQELLESPADPFVTEFIRAQRSTLAEYDTDG